DRFWFLEMNTRLQVEHPVTEEVHGVDLVELQLAVAEHVVLPTPPPGVASAARPEGWAVEVRLYAEDPSADYQPQSGRLRRFEIPETDGIRVEAGYASGSRVSTFYDAMLAKVIAHADTRELAVRRLVVALRKARIHGLRTNRDQLIAVLTSEAFRSGQVTTALLADGVPMVTDATEVANGSPQESQAHRSVRIAAAVALAERTRRPGIPVAWRNVVSQPQRTEFDDGTVAEWRGTRTGYEVEGVDVVAATPSSVTLEADGARTTYEVSIDGDDVDVDSPLGHTALRRKPRFTDPADQVAEGSLLAPMPGSVVAVHAEEGEYVTAGQRLLVLEAMKMQHTISAPADGVLTKVNVKAGSQVGAGEVLAVVEESE
ncbi:MAG: biotin/lipoyl-binding protein, partial [Nocardioides sp.]|nr:biotin/lipoyl-binding protein [Nocardioides sp.]